MSDRVAAAAAATILLMLLIGLLSPLLPLADPFQQTLSLRRHAPSFQYLLGNDEFGRDELSRLLAGARITIPAAFLAVLIGVVPGTALGLLAAYSRGWVDFVLMRLTDLMLAFPYFVLGIILVALVGVGVAQAIVAVGVASLPSFIRVARGAALSVLHDQYVEAAAAIGCGGARVLLRHVLPNALGPILVNATTAIGASTLAVAGLGFLGLGAQPPLAEWGTMLGAGRDYITDAPHIVLFPALAITLLVLCASLAGDGLRSALDATITEPTRRSP